MTQTRNDPRSAWNLWTALIALAFLVLWLIVCPLHLFGPTAFTTAPSINPLASTEVTTTPITLTGTGAPNSSLQLRIGETVDLVTVGADGTWSTVPHAFLYLRVGRCSRRGYFRPLRATPAMNCFWASKKPTMIGRITMIDAAINCPWFDPASPMKA